jgi:TrmH family RNA methyltransferase
MRYARRSVLFNHAVTEIITSEKNPLLKEVRRAAARGALTADGLAVAEGFHLLDEALRSRCEIASVIVAEHAQAEVEKRVQDFPRARVLMVAEGVFADLTTTETPQGVITLVRPPVWTLDQMLSAHPLLVVLDALQDPGNAGAVIRAAEAFGATGVVFLKGSVNPYNPKCLRGSAGSIFRLPVVAAIEESLLLTELRQKGILLYAALPRAQVLLKDAEFTAACAIVIGSEGRGVSPALEREAEGIRIPTTGVESLNAAVAAGVMLYEASRQRASS